MKKDWQTYALLALAAVAWWFVQDEIREFKNQNRAQWQEAAKTKDCYMAELTRVKERLSYLEGFRAGEQNKGK